MSGDVPSVLDSVPSRRQLRTRLSSLGRLRGKADLAPDRGAGVSGRGPAGRVGPLSVVSGRIRFTDATMTWRRLIGRGFLCVNFPCSNVFTPMSS